MNSKRRGNNAKQNCYKEYITKNIHTRHKTRTRIQKIRKNTFLRLERKGWGK